tara:strand:- start:1081 stop:1776 length:696 start_codon:yes stop_codon:yes gene_type:complete
MEEQSTDEENWERARKPEQIEARRAAIVAAAKRLLDEKGVEGAGLSSIAREAGLSKANLYRYFESREAVLIEILLFELKSWTASLGQRLNELPPNGGVSAVAQVVADSLEGRARFCELLASLASVLERNLGMEAIENYKRELKAEYISLIPPLQAALPQLSKSQANEFLIMQAMFQIGLWSHAKPADSVVEVLKSEEFSDLRMDFFERIRWHSLILLRGLESMDQPRTKPQ